MADQLARTNAQIDPSEYHRWRRNRQRRTGGDTTPTVRVNDAPAQQEGVGNNSVFRVRSTDTELPLSADITFTYQTMDGTAQAGLDYTKIDPTAGTIPAAVGYVDISVALLGPVAGWAPPRSFSLSVSNVQQSGGDYPVSKSSGTGIITDSSAEPTVAISARGSPDPIEQDPTLTGTQTHTVTLTGVTTDDVLIPHSTRDGSATAGSDYTAKSGTATITGGQTSVDIDITILAGATVTAIENYFVDLGNVTTRGYSLTVTDATGEGRISQQGYDPNPISMSDGAPSPQTEADPAGITFTLSSAGTPPLIADVTGTWRTVNGTAIADAPGDFTGVTSAPFTIPAATGTVDVVVALEAADAVWAPDRSFTAEIATATAPIGDGSGTGTITDSLTKPTISISDGVPNPAIKGTHPTITFTLTAAVAPKYDILVDVVTVDGTASAGTDYTAVNTTVTIPAGQTTATVNVTVLP